MNRTMPSEITALHGKRIKSVSAGSQHTMVILENGELWAMGNNEHGELGVPEIEDTTLPLQVMAFAGKNVVDAACGFNHVIVLLDSGEAFAWGDNGHGQLGLSDTDHRATPTLITALSGKHVKAICCSSFHSAAFLESGEAFVWGSNDFGQLWSRDHGVCEFPVQLTGFEGKRVISLSTGNRHTAALDTGELFTLGCNHDGQLGLGGTNNRDTPTRVEALFGRRVTAAACSEVHTLALLENGAVFAWGSNANGQLGIGDGASGVSTPQQVHFFDGRSVKSIHCSGYRSAAVLENGELYLWGLNDSGQLGLGDTSNRSTPQRLNRLKKKYVINIGLSSLRTFALVK